MSFDWSVKAENDTETIPVLEPDNKDTRSYLKIYDDKARTYRCIASNSVGSGTMCSIEITGKGRQSLQSTIFIFKLTEVYI